MTRDVVRHTDLAALLTELSGPPTRNGGSARWRCPDRNHPDDHPSVTMFVDRNHIPRWRCWSGGHGGTAIDAVIAAHDLDIAAAFRFLEQRTPTTPPPVAPAPSKPARDGPRPLTRRVRDWVHRSHQRLHTGGGTPARQWLTHRGLPPEIIAANLMGWQPARHDNTYGLPRHDAIVIPSFDQRGELAYAQARNLNPAAAGSKYTNPTPGHGTMPPVVFPRGGPTHGPLVVTEGVLDGLVVTAAGYRAASVFSAAACTGPSGRTIAETLAQAANGEPVVLALDADAAGNDATRHLTNHLNAVGITPKRLVLPPGCDLGTVWQTTTPSRTHTHPPAMRATP